MKVTQISNARTQKARGILAVKENHFFQVETLVIALPLTEEDEWIIKDFMFMQTAGNGVFCRPCPTVPRHGFVDSRAVKSIEEVRAVAAETLAADPLGELVFMPLVDADLSAVVTPFSVAVGKGHDGATQGKNVHTFPLAFVKVPNFASSVVTDTPYFEMLQSCGTVNAVQVRDGLTPAVGYTGGNWVPAATTVSAVIEAGGDALEFEQAIHNAPAGAVLWHPAGSILSHYSQHAMVRSMPIIFDADAPALGSTYAATAVKSDPNVSRFGLGFSAGMHMDLRHGYGDSIKFAVTMLHNASALAPHVTGAYLLGTACAFILRFAEAAICGEYRHKRRGNNSGHRIGRDTVFANLLEGLPAFLANRKTVRSAYKSFSTSRWPSGYGGEKWADCTETTLSLEVVCAQFVAHPSIEALNRIIGATHNVVNCAHNNGPFLSKFVTSRAFDNAAAGDFIQTCFAGFTAWRMLEKAVDAPIAPAQFKSRTSRKVAAAAAAAGTDRRVLQFNTRDNGMTYHFQYGTQVTYKSCTLPLSSFDFNTLNILATAAQGKRVTSLAGSSTKYNRLDINSLSVLLLEHLNANHFNVAL